MNTGNKKVSAYEDIYSHFWTIFFAFYMEIPSIFERYIILKVVFHLGVIYTILHLGS